MRTRTIWSAYAQLQTYKAEIPTLLHYNAALVVSDGLQARMGSVTADQEWFKVWRTIDGEGDAPKTALELEVLVRGAFERQRFLDLLHHFIVFEEDPDSGALHKIIAGYHQFHAVNAAVEETVRASGMTETGSVLREEAGTAGPGVNAAASRATVARAWSGARRAAERVSPCSSCRPRGAASGDAEPDAGGADRPQRPGRPASRPVPTLRGHPRPDAGAGQRAASICASC